MEIIIAYTQPNSAYTVEWTIFQFDVEEPYNVQTYEIDTDEKSKILYTGTFEDCFEYLQNNID